MTAADKWGHTYLLRDGTRCSVDAGANPPQNWLVYFFNIETDGATFLFGHSKSRIHVSINQGTTAQELGELVTTLHKTRDRSIRRILAVKLETGDLSTAVYKDPYDKEWGLRGRVEKY